MGLFKLDKKPISGKAYHTIRILIALYLLYTDYNLINGLSATEDKYKVFIIGAMIIFAIAGIALLYVSGRALYQLWKEDRDQNS